MNKGKEWRQTPKSGETLRPWTGEQNESANKQHFGSACVTM